MTGLFTFGEALGLLTPPTVGALRHQDLLRLSMGGAESNTAIAVARLGGEATWLGRIPDDGIGELIESSIRGQGVRVRSIADRGPSSLMIKDRRSVLRTRVLYWRSNGPGSRLRPEDLPEDELRAHRMLHVTGITPALSASARATVFAALEIAGAAGVTVSFDVNYRSTLWSPDNARTVLSDLAARADILLVGEDELALVGIDADDPERAAMELGARGPRDVIVKRGSRGAIAVIDGSIHSQSAIEVPVVDTVGAGDAFAGGYLAEYLCGGLPTRRLEVAAACGAFAVTAPGDWEAAPTRADLAAIESGARVDR